MIAVTDQGSQGRGGAVARVASLWRQVTSIKLHIADRLFEWYAAAVMMLMALSMAAPHARLMGAFAILIEWGFSQRMFLLFFAIFGSVRIFALVANGNLPHGGPVVRVLCAFVAVPVWCMLTVALMRDWLYSGELSLGIAVYLPLMLCDMYAAKRATLDVGRR